MQVKLEDCYVILREVLLEGVYLAIARLDPFRRRQPVDAGHQHVFIMRSVEDADHPHWRYGFVDAPQEIMRQFVSRWFLKAGRDDSERVDRAEDPTNGAVLATGIRTLQNHKDRLLGLGVEDFLQAVDFGNIAGSCSFGFRSRER